MWQPLAREQFASWLVRPQFLKQSVEHRDRCSWSMHFAATWKWPLASKCAHECHLSRNWSIAQITSDKCCSRKQKSASLQERKSRCHRCAKPDISVVGPDRSPKI